MVVLPALMLTEKERLPYCWLTMVTLWVPSLSLMAPNRCEFPIITLSTYTVVGGEGLIFR